MKNRKIRYMCHGAAIAAIYTLLTAATWSFSSMQIQLRISEALTVLPLLTPAAIPGLFAGCFLSNILAGNVIDAVFGSLTTLLAAICTYLIGQKIKNKTVKRLTAPLPPVLFNMIAVPLILYYGYGFREFLGQTTLYTVLSLNALSVMCGQILSCYVLGLPLYMTLQKLNIRHPIF